MPTGLPTNRPLLFIAASLLLAPVATCGNDRGGDADDRLPSADPPSLSAQPEAPATKEGIIVVNGTAEPMTLRRYESPPNSPVSFSTYVPERLVVAGEGAEPGPAASGDSQFDGEWSVRFVTEDASEAARAALEVVFLRPGTSEEDGRAHVRRAAEEAGNELVETIRSTPWGLVQHRFQGDDVAGFVTLGHYQDRYFELFVRYPPQWDEGFPPRAAWILEEWVWEDSGEPLQSLVTY